MCSMLSGNCPSSMVAGLSVDNYNDCIDSGYAVAQSTYRNLEELEEYNRDYLEQIKFVVKKCKEMEEKHNGISSRYL